MSNDENIEKKMSKKKYRKRKYRMMKTSNDENVEKKMSKVLAYSNLDYSDINNVINFKSKDKFFK